MSQIPVDTRKAQILGIIAQGFTAKQKYKGHFTAKVTQEKKMSQIPVDTRKAQILGIIAQGFTANKDIQVTAKERLGLSERTIQRFVKGYLADGSLQLKARHYSLTREGQEWLRKRQGTPELPLRDSKLRGIIDKLPTPQHRAFVYFILAAITAKLHLWDKEDTFWPSFIVGGPTGDIKTLLAEIVCETLKLPKAKHIQDTIRKTEPQVLGTFDKVIDGVRTLDPAPYFSYVFITWDDLDKVSNRSVWRALMSYIDGWAYREERGTYLEKRHTCLVTMNFETATLEIPEPYIRRAFVIDSKGLHCDPMQNEIIGREIGEALKDCPKLKTEGLTVSFKKLKKADIDFMRELLYRGLRSKEEGRVIDTNFLEKIVLGWLILQQSGDVREVVYWAVEGALLFLQTQGRTKEGWRDELTTEWGNYRAGRDPDFDKEWTKHLEQVKSNGKQVEEYKKGKEKVEIDEKIKQKRLLAKYSPALDKLKDIKASFLEMDTSKHKTVLLYLNVDIRDFESKLPTEKRESKVTESVLEELEVILDEWEEQLRPMQEAWEAEQKRLEELKRATEKCCDYLSKLKLLLTDYFDRGKKDSKGVLWSHRTKEVRNDIGKVLNPASQGRFYNKDFLDSINERAQALLLERKEQIAASKVKVKGGVEIMEKVLYDWTKEDKDAFIQETVVKHLDGTSKPLTITVPYWKYLLMKLDRKLKARHRSSRREPETKWNGRPFDEGKSRGYEGRSIEDL